MDKSLNYDITDCQYCLFYGGRKHGCTLDKLHCPYKEPTYNELSDIEDDTGFKSHAPDVKTKDENEKCSACIYAREQPCIGYCLKKCIYSIGIIR